MTVRKYDPPPSVAGFLASDKFSNLIMGPYGSTKTTAGLMKIAYEAQRVAACTDGIRRSRCVWVRNTREQLQDTSIPDFLKWYPDGDAGVFVKTGMKFILRFNDVECEVLFRGLDDSDDVRRLLSLQLTFGVMDEFREIHPDIYEALQGRIGRYPDGMMVPHRPEWGVDDKGNPIQGCVDDYGQAVDKIWGMSNPPDADTYWEGLLSDPPSNLAVFFQPSGLSPEADWIHLLKSNYYENLAEGKSQDWIDVYIRAKFGKSLQGKPVFSSFDKEIHVSKERLHHVTYASQPLLIGVDAGLTPAAVPGQLAYDGRLQVFESIVSEGMGALRFIREKLKPVLASRFPGMSPIIIIDPAANQRVQTDEKTVAEIYKAEGFAVRFARTNALAARLAAVDNLLTRMVDSKPMVLMDPACQALITAARSKYRYKRLTNGEYNETPEKSHPWSDVADAFQYLSMEVDGGASIGAAFKRGVTRREVKKSNYHYG